MKKNKIFVAIISIYVLAILAIQLFTSDNTYSISERRTLARLPEISFKNIISGKFMDDFETYSLDQFPYRDTFRQIKAYSQKDIFFKKDNNNYIYKDSHLSKLEYPYHKEMIDYAARIFHKINEKYLVSQNIQPYLAIIPDKNYYLLEDTELKMNYEMLVNDLISQVDFKYIDLFDKLTLDDYYYTDTHWRQENILDVAKYISQSMGNTINQEFNVHPLNKPFKGVYLGQSCLKVKEDTINYLTNTIIDQCIVENLEKGTIGPVYNMEKADGNDAYEMFLSGTVSLLHLTNDLSQTNQKLILFRDSFGSSLAPLLLENYHDIYVVDLRYVSSDMLDKFIDFKDADVLFIYSTLILNNSLSLK